MRAVTEVCKLHIRVPRWLWQTIQHEASKKGQTASAEARSALLKEFTKRHPNRQPVEEKAADEGEQ